MWCWLYAGSETTATDGMLETTEEMWVTNGY